MKTATARPLGARPKKRRSSDSFEFQDVLDAFREDFLDRDDTLEDLDRVYSQAIAEGVVTEEECATAAKAIREKVCRSARKAQTQSSVRRALRDYLARRRIEAADLAKRFKVPISVVQALANSTEKFTPTTEALDALAMRLGLTAHVPAAAVRALLQDMRVILELARATGPSLQAARKKQP